MRPPTSEEKKKFHRCDAQLIGFDKKEGWKDELPFYKFKCPTHGEQIDYEHGFKQILYCVHCRNELHDKSHSCDPYKPACIINT
jgi:hypothetical protein